MSIENKSPILPTIPPHEIPSKELSPAAKVAKKILSMEKNTDSVELDNVVTKLSSKENVNDLKCLKLFLTHLNQLDGGKGLIPKLIHNIEINEDGTSNMESMRVPILNMINQDNIARIQEIAQDPDLFLKWLRFSIVKAKIETDKIRPDLVQKFLNSNIAKINFIDFTKKVNQDGIGVTDRMYSIKYVDSLRVLFNDEELMEAVVEFNLKYPKSSVPLLQWIRNDLSSTKQLLKKAITEEDKAEILSKVVFLDTLFLLPSINTLFEHPSLSKKELLLLDNFLNHYPANAQVGISMLLLALDHPELADKISQFLSSSKKTKELDFLSNFMNEKKLFSEKTQFFTSFFDLLDIQTVLNIKLDEISWFSEDNFIQVVKHIKELPKEKFDLLKEVIGSEKVEFFYWAMTVGLLDGYEIDLKEMTRIFDWMVANPSEYQMIVRICNSVSDRNDLFTYGNFGILLWMFIKHYPEDFSTVLNFSQGNVGVSLGYITAAMKELKFDELEELKKYKGKKNEGPNIADFTQTSSQLQKLKDLSIAEKRKINELMYCKKEELVNKIMNLFHNDPELASSILTIATTHNQKKIAEEILEEYKSRPDSLFSRTLKKIAPHPKSILEVYDLKSNEEMLESICNDSSVLEKKKNLIQPEFLDKDLKPIFEFVNNWHTENEKLYGKYQLHSLILNSFISKISKEIIDSSGEINLKVVDQLLEAIKTSKLPIGVDYLNHITFILNALKDNEDLGVAFSNLTLQDNIPPGAALMVRATTGIASDAPITTAHLKIAALAALLTHERQPPDVGSCVGASRLSYMSKHPVQCMKFISEMLLKGGVSMDISEKKQVFIHCQPKPSDLLLKTDYLTFTKQEERAIPNDNIYPGVLKLANYLGVEESQVKDWMQRALDKGVFTNVEARSDKLLSVSHRELIKALMDETDSSCSLDIAEIVYLSALENLPARSLEGLFVSSDAVETANLRRAILAPIKALSRAVSPNKINKRIKIFDIQCENGEQSPCALPKSLQEIWKKEGSEDLLKELKAQIGNHFDLVYDPSATSFDGDRSCRVLIDATSPIEGRPDSINTKDLFLKLCSKACVKTLANFEGELTDEFKHELSSYMGSERFAKAVSLHFSYISEELNSSEDKDKMKSYDPFLENKAIVGQLPWSLQGGARNSPWELVSSKGENNKLYDVNSICREPKDIFNLIENIRGIHNLNTPNYQHYAGSMPGHAINFDFSHPQLKEFLQSEDLEKWLESNCIAPSKKIAEETFVTEKDYEVLKSKIKEKLPKPLRKKWKDSTVRSFEHPSNIVEVRNFLKNQLTICLGTEKEAVPEAFNALEEGLIKLIPEESRRKSPMLPIIDTNWVDKDKMHDIYFALYFSPASSKWELWKVDYDQKNIQKASNDKWFSNSNPYYTAFFIA